jgi:NTE family protein
MGGTGHDVTRALVLGGGGVAGIAWETGVLLGLFDAGVDLAGADRVIGTSAGSAVAAQITSGVPLVELFARQVSPDGMKHEIAAEFDAEQMMTEFGRILSGVKPGIEMNKAIGDYALKASTVAEPLRRDVIAARLPSRSWPDRDLQIVAVDAASGEPRVFASGDVDLVDAVAASCAVPGIWPPVSIEGRRYIDGGMRSASNADLATGCDDVLVIAPMAELPMVAPDVKQRIDELERVARVVTIRPDEASTAAMGMNPLDPATARPSAEAGRVQAAAHVAEVAALWSARG